MATLTAHRSPAAKAALRVSVVIPTHNRAEFVGPAVTSALSQTLAPAEVIVVDDCSTDATSDALAPFADKIQVIRTSNNVERGAARNIGARAATGELLAFLDSDDLWEPDKLARQTVMASTHGPSVTGVRYVDEGGNQVASPYIPCASSDQRIAVDNWCLGGASSLLLPAQAFHEVNGYPEGRCYQGSEDWILLVKLFWAGWQLGVVPEPLIRYRIHSGGFTQNPESIAQCMWSACDWLDAQRLGNPGLARIRRNGIATVIARAYIANGDWRKGLKWTRTAMRIGGPQHLLGNGWRVARTAGRRLLLPRSR